MENTLVRNLLLLIFISACGGTGVGEKGSGDNPSNEPQGVNSKLSSECKLQNPIEIGSVERLAENKVRLKNIKISDPLPNGEMFAASLALEIFTIEDMPYIGARLSEIDSNGDELGFGFGFADVYRGSMQFSGGVSRNGDQSYIHTIEESDYKAPTSEEPARTELEMLVERSSIVSIRLTIPVSTEANGIYRYSGKNKAICIIAGELDQTL